MMKSNNLLSIIVPIYNCIADLEICINSILKQSYNNFECILVDDGSTDGSSKMCDDFALIDARIRVYHKTQGGVSSARNLGLDMATGDFIAFVDADDCIDYDMYEILMNVMLYHKCDIVACSYVAGPVCTPSTNSTVPSPVFLANTVEIYRSATRKHLSIEGYIWNKVINKDIIGKTRFNETITMCEDCIFSWDVFSNATSAYYIDLPMYHYRIRDNSSTRSSSISGHMTAIKAYEYMISKAEKIDYQCTNELYIQYLNWNRAVMRKILMTDCPTGNNNLEMYQIVSKNIILNCHKVKRTMTQMVLDFPLRFGIVPTRVIYVIHSYLVKLKKYKETYAS